jgi:hypothetical protein
MQNIAEDDNSKSKRDFAVVISYYEERPINHLKQLLDSLEPHKSSVLIVINSNRIKNEPVEKKMDGWNSIIRPNLGMNIGAWDEGFRHAPKKDFYFFLQDECFLKKEGMIEYCLNKFYENPKIGMMGETLNRKWDHPWEVLKNSSLNHFELQHEINGKSIRRVDFYLQMMKKFGIECGDSGLHIRTLCLSLRGETLREMSGFPIGLNKGECIASEIGISRKVAQLGWEFDQINLTPFYFFGHKEWKSDGSSKK